MKDVLQYNQFRISENCMPLTVAVCPSAAEATELSGRMSNRIVQLENNESVAEQYRVLFMC